MKQDKAEEKIRQDTEQYDVCACCRHKSTPRDAAKQKKLTSRINRIIGQLSGIQNMLDDNRYCGDILIQIGAVESALQGLVVNNSYSCGMMGGLYNGHNLM